jgi:hypothetical protein
LWLRFAGSFLSRFAARQFLALLFQLPPRFTRSEPFGGFPGSVLADDAASANSTSRQSSQTPATP